MRTLSLVLFGLALALVTSAAMAQTCPAVVAEPVCPEPCPAPVQAVCPTTVSSPTIDVGASPVSQLSGLSCPDFDKAYVPAMYQLNADIIALTAYGSENANSSNVRDFSRAVMHRYQKYNRQLDKLYTNITCLACPTVSADRVQGIISQLSKYCGAEFDAAYINALGCLMEQSKDMAQLAITNTANDDLRSQASDVIRLANKDLGKIGTYQQVGFLTWNDYNGYCSVNVADARCYR